MNNYKYKILPFERNFDRSTFKINKQNKIIYNKLIEDTVYNLKSITNLNLSLRGWELLIGPWLLKYIQIFTNRFRLFRKIEHNYSKNVQVKLDKFNDCSFICKDLIDFQLKANDQKWNDKLFSYIWSKYIVKKKKKN